MRLKIKFARALLLALVSIFIVGCVQHHPYYPSDRRAESNYRYQQPTTRYIPVIVNKNRHHHDRNTSVKPREKKATKVNKAKARVRRNVPQSNPSIDRKPDRQNPVYRPSQPEYRYLPPKEKNNRYFESRPVIQQPSTRPIIQTPARRQNVQPNYSPTPNYSIDQKRNTSSKPVNRPAASNNRPSKRTNTNNNNSSIDNKNVKQTSQPARKKRY
ncbi:MAG: hypothetical protein KAH84_12215 [Thiomargarita sp.]|nr:hypothetical protein [Thiomargarita sp.]